MSYSITIIIPTYNGDKYISETIESCLNLNYINYKLLVIDDCSNDKTFERVSNFTSDKITIVKNKVNLGLTKNINKALSFVESDYFILLGQDDLLDKEHLNIMTKCIDTDTAIVHCNSYIIDKNNQKIGVSRIDNIQIKKTKSAMLELSIDNFISSTGMLQKTSVFNMAGGWDENYKNFGEWLFYIKALDFGGIKYTSEIRAYYRRHDTNITNTFTIKNVSKSVDLYKKYCRLFAWNKVNKSLNIVMYYYFKTLIRHIKYIRNGN
ncbi:glycosyltransferase [uncultured Photobacterium sp.]|uniref:glycosyltransferase n=1 Tax=uncultured Photobacterium sp. TaxID=173973 RepID=UPI00261AA277|nr:glycosyltransferase [uncultured Photobacterium sp.]